MFDATPEKETLGLRDTQSVRNETISRVIQERIQENPGGARLALEALRELHLAGVERSEENACVTDQDALEFIALWDQEEQLLQDAIRVLTGLGPFRLIKTTAAYYDLDGKRRVLCRFAYRGSPEDRTRLEQVLIEALHQLAPWESVRRSA